MNKDSQTNTTAIDANTKLLPVLMSPDKLWGCVASNGRVDYSTLSYTKRDSIAKCVAGLNPIYFGWKYFRKKGWKCTRLEVSCLYWHKIETQKRFCSKCQKTTKHIIAKHTYNGVKGEVWQCPICGTNESWAE